MTLDELLESIPDYAKDLRLNLGSVLSPQGMSDSQIWGTALASAMTTGNASVIQAFQAEAGSRLSDVEQQAAKGAAAIMGMNNVYFRFLHLASNEEYGSRRAGLRMNVIRTHGVAREDFELWATAVSAINGCGACVDSHEKVLREKGVSEETVLAAVRIASVIAGVSAVLTAEAALA